VKSLLIAANLYRKGCNCEFMILLDGFIKSEKVLLFSINSKKGRAGIWQK
jgi:hypothetical protein